MTGNYGTIMLVFKIDKKTWQSLDIEKERLELSQLIDNAFKSYGSGRTYSFFTMFRLGNVPVFAGCVGCFYSIANHVDC